MCCCVVVILLCVVFVVLICVVVVVLYCVLPLVGILSEISKRLSAPVSNQYRGWVGGGEHERLQRKGQQHGGL